MLIVTMSLFPGVLEVMYLKDGGGMAKHLLKLVCVIHLLQFCCCKTVFLPAHNIYSIASS